MHIKNKMILSVGLICIIELILLTFNIGILVLESNDINKQIYEINNIIHIGDSSDNDDKINISELILKNSDTVGWINVNGTNINYPFVKYTNNKFYLNHSFNKSKNSAGWIFMDYRNSKDISDKNTIIYGHAMLNETMFGSLKNTIKKSWYEDKSNHYITIYTEKEKIIWQIFSIYYIEKDSFYLQTEFDDKDTFKEFINIIYKRSKIKFDADISSDDKILTLSTCYSKNKRLVVHAKLIKKEMIE